MTAPAMDQVTGSKRTKATSLWLQLLCIEFLSDVPPSGALSKRRSFALLREKHRKNANKKATSNKHAAFVKPLSGEFCKTFPLFQIFLSPVDPPLYRPRTRSSRTPTRTLNVDTEPKRERPLSANARIDSTHGNSQASRGESPQRTEILWPKVR